jgi:hypothetical protein
LARADAEKIHDLHLLISSVSRREHLDLFENGIARKIDFAYAGPQSLRMAQLLEDRRLEIGAIHTYVELYARMFIDLIPNVALVYERHEVLSLNHGVGFDTAAIELLLPFPEDLGIHPLDAKRSLLAAKSIEDLVAWSGGLYKPPARFKSW